MLSGSVVDAKYGGTKQLAALATRQGRTFTGNPDALLKSSAYTRCMAVAMALAHRGLDVGQIQQHLAVLKL